MSTGRGAQQQGRLTPATGNQDRNLPHAARKDSTAHMRVALEASMLLSLLLLFVLKKVEKRAELLLLLLLLLDVHFVESRTELCRLLPGRRRYTQLSWPAPLPSPSLPSSPLPDALLLP